MTGRIVTRRMRHGRWLSAFPVHCTDSPTQPTAISLLLVGFLFNENHVQVSKWVQGKMALCQEVEVVAQGMMGGWWRRLAVAPPVLPGSLTVLRAAPCRAMAPLTDSCTTTEVPRQGWLGYRDIYGQDIARSMVRILCQLWLRYHNSYGQDIVSAMVRILCQL